MSGLIEEIERTAFTIILHAGNARSDAMEAIYLAKAGKFIEAKEKISMAEKEFIEAHNVQTKLLQKEAQGEQIHLSVILIHSQDHLMTAMTVKDFATEMIDLYEKINRLEHHFHEN